MAELVQINRHAADMAKELRDAADRLERGEVTGIGMIFTERGVENGEFVAIYHAETHGDAHALVGLNEHLKFAIMDGFRGGL